MVDCIEKTGRELNLNNQGIVKYLCGIEEERKNLELIIQKQYQERKRIEADIERLTYKLCLINKSLAMRIKAKNNYDKTIEEIKGHYECLVASSNKLRQVVEKTQQELDDIMNKKTGTSSGPEGEEIKMLYVKPGGDLDPNDCVCSYTADVPTKDKSGRVLPPDSSKTSNAQFQEPPKRKFSPVETNEQVSLGQMEEVQLQQTQFSRSYPGSSKYKKPSVSASGIRASNFTVDTIPDPKSKVISSVSSSNTGPPTKSPESTERNEYDSKQALPMEESTFSEVSTGGTSSDPNKKDVSKTRSSNKSKNMLLSRIRPTTNTRGSDRLIDRMSTLIPGSAQKSTTRNMNTDEHKNKLQRDSLDDLLHADSATRESKIQ